MKRFTLFLVLLFSTVSWGGELCTHNPMQVDVCRAASAISEAIAVELPFRLNQNLILQNIEASENVIRMSAALVYTEAHLTQSLRTGVTLNDMKASVRETAILIACRPKTELQAFIELGGELQFMYFFSDKAHFLTVSVDHCTP